MTVDPRRDETNKTNPLLTLTRKSGEVVWQRRPGDFEDFRFPMHACVGADGRHLVFGGYSVHNFGVYREGLRFYGSDGRLIRFVSRRDLPGGPRRVSTAHWYDSDRTHIDENRLLFFTPGVKEPMVFDIRTGDVLAGEIVEGQGDDRKWFDRPASENGSYNNQAMP